MKRDGLEPGGMLNRVAELIARGMSNYEIADMLCIDPRTVERHISRLGEALGLKEKWRGQLRVGIVRWWYEVGKFPSDAMWAMDKVPKRVMFCEFCGDAVHRLERVEGLDEVWICEQCGARLWFRTG